MPAQQWTPAQREAAQTVCENYGVAFNAADWFHPFDLPDGYVAGRVGPVFVGIDPDGRRCS